ncbi:MAG: DUF1007 family protein [Rhodospirillaceae bacterium]|nr:DUF1007 family protein [Rhodospirillaceae bacterium]
MKPARLVARLVARGLLACGMAGFAGAAPAAAHPHVFVENRVVFDFADGKVQAIGVTWAFDEIFSGDLLMQFDADGDGTFDELESKAVGEGVLPNLAQFHYFTYVYVDGQLLDPVPPSAFVASARDNVVTFQMTVPLPAPVDPRGQALAVEVNDREYYVAVELAESDPVMLANADGVPCGASIREDHENAYFGGFVYPQEIALQCR